MYSPKPLYLPSSSMYLNATSLVPWLNCAAAYKVRQHAVCLRPLGADSTPACVLFSCLGAVPADSPACFSAHPPLRTCTRHH